MIGIPSTKALDLQTLGPVLGEGIPQVTQSFSLKSNAKGHYPVTNNLLNDTIPQILGLQWRI